MRAGMHGYEALRLGIDGHLPLSLYLPVDTKAMAYYTNIDGTARQDGSTRVEGLWTLAIDSTARKQLEHDYEFAANRNYIAIGEIGGASVKSGRYRFQLEPQSERSGMSTRPRSAFPEGSVIAIRTSALDVFISNNGNAAPEEAPVQEKPSPENPLGDRERTTLLTVIGALCQHAGIDLTKPSAAGTAIEAMTQAVGARVSARTIEDHLKKVRDALERRGKTS